MNKLFLLAFLLPACTKPDETDSGIDTDDPLVDNAPIRSCDVVVKTTAPAGVTSVALGGRFNDWTPVAMADADGDGTWEYDLGELRPGTYGHKFIFDDVWETLPPDVRSTWDDGVENRALVVGDCERPQLDAVAGTADADGNLTASFRFTRAAHGAPLDAGSVVVTVGGEPVDADVDASTGIIAVDVSGLAPGKVSVRVHAEDVEGNTPENGDGFLPLWVEAEPFIWQSGLMYYVFLDRFKDGGDSGLGPIAGTRYGTDYLGGDLVGARQKLDDGYFDTLGIRTIWLSPINQNPDQSYIGSSGDYFSGYHGYWPIKGREVEDRLGTTSEPAADALKSFIDTAHEHGIRVIFDSVLNHVHEQHEYIDEHPEWFTADPCPCGSSAECSWDGNPIGCWFTDYLPDLDYKQQAVVDQSVSDLMYWVEVYDVDGFRVDAAKHMDHVILRTTSLALKERYERAGGAHLYTVGETFVGAGGQGAIMDYVAPYELDGQFDFTLLYPLRNAIGSGQGFRGLASEVRSSDAAYGDSVDWMSVFLGNHDVDRYSTYIAGCRAEWQLFGGCADVLDQGSPSDITGDEWDLVNKLSMSFAFVTTQPGVPLIYYGDEIGLAGSSDPDNRRLMPWTDWSLAQTTLHDRVAELGQLRLQTPALQTGERVELWVDDSLYVYARDNGNGDVAIVAMATAERSQSIPMPTRLSLEGTGLHNALADTRSISVSGGAATIELHPWEYVVFVPNE